MGNHFSHDNNKNNPDVHNNSVDYDVSDDYDDDDGINEERHQDNHKRVKIVLGHSDDDDDDDDQPSEAEYTSEVDAFVKAYCSRK